LDPNLSFFTTIESLKTFIQLNKKGFVLIDYRTVQEYEGIVLCITFLFNQSKKEYHLDLQWISFGLDLFGEHFLENYVYQFTTLEKLLEYLNETYKIQVYEIPIHYQFDEDKFPNPIKNSTDKPKFEKSWAQFQEDFKERKFLDQSLNLVYST
jgi:hypothetical protein